MKVTTQRAVFAIELSASGEPPSEFRLFQAGPNKTHDGRGCFVFDDLSVASVRKHSEERGIADYAIDYEHASLNFLMADPAESGKAAGWFKPEFRDGALYATQVQWTPKATEKLKAREFRYFSPAADYETTPDGTKRISKLINCALTNNPALAGIPPLMASAVAGVPKENRMKTLFAALSLAEDATEAQALAALTALRDSRAAFLALSAKPTDAEALGVITGWKTEAAKVAALSAKVTELETAKLSGERDGLIEQGKKDGKLPPALEPWAKTQTSESLKAFLSAAPTVVAPPVKEPEKAVALQADAALSQVAQLMGQDPKKVAEFKASKTVAA